MTSHNYIFANKVFKIETLYDYFSLYAKDYCTNDKEDLLITNTLEEIQAWKETHKENANLEIVEVYLVQDKVAKALAKDNIFIMHGSSLYIDDKKHGYIFVGPSGVGKSTHVNLLQQKYKDRLVIINDDKPFISFKDSKCYIYGSPWSGKSHISMNTYAELKSIFVLEQAKDNSLSKLDASEAISRLFKQIYIPKGFDESNKGLDLLVSLVNNIPIYLLSVNATIEATDYMDKLLEE